MYLLAGTYAALGVPIWALQYAGVLPGPGMLWHAHFYANSRYRIVPLKPALG